MNRKILMLLLFVIIFSFCVSAEGYRVAYLTTNVNQYDQYIYNIFVDKGFSVDVIDNDNVASVNWSNYNMMYIPGKNFNNYDQIPVNQVPALVMGDSNNIVDWNWAASGTSSIGSSHPLHAYNQNSGHIITEGMPYDIQIYSSCCYNGGLSVPALYISKENRALDTDSILSTTNHRLDGIIVAINKGDHLKHNVIANARGVFFGITQRDYWTSESEQMFRNSIDWILFGNDMDGDGYYSDVDCDDNNANVYPGADEIPYNGIDENCDGNILDDLDADGSYSDAAVGGSPDCNDGNNSIHPGAVEIIDNIDQNCVNDAPILLENMPNAIWEEDSIKNDYYNLTNYFADYEGDLLTFSSVGNFNINLNIYDRLVDLIPNSNWNGIEYVRFLADDGHNGTKYSNNITLKVNPVNDAPVIQHIDDITAYAGDLIVLNVNASDVDGDILNIIYNFPFDSNGRWQTNKSDIGIRTTSVRADDGILHDTESFTVTIMPRVLINEFLVKGDEWVELYNPNNQVVVVEGWSIEDNTGNPYVLTGSVGPYGFKIINPTFELNNAGDVLILKSGSDIIDKVAYGNYDDGNVIDNALLPSFGQSLGRIEDGYDTDVDNVDFRLYDWPTKGFSNLDDATPPIVTLEYPVDNSNWDTSLINASYSVNDNEDYYLDCYIYTDVNGEFQIENTQEVANGDSALFWFYDVSDGSYIWNVKCVDNNGNGAFATNNWTFNIEVNDAPVIQHIDDIEISENDLVSFNVVAEDSDSVQLYYSTENLPDGAVFDESNHEFSWQTNYYDDGVYVVTFNVNDGEYIDSENVTITVNDVNRVPVFNGTIEDIVINEDESLIDYLDLSNYFTDQDLDNALSYMVGVISADEWSVDVNINNSLVSLLPYQDWNGIASVSFTVNDGMGGSVSSNTFTVIVNPVNDAPMLISDINNYSWSEDSSLDNEFDLNDYFMDVEGDELIYSVDGNLDINVDIINGSVSFSQPMDWNGIEYVRFLADDGNLSTYSNEITLTVNNVNENPVIKGIEDIEIEEDADEYLIELNASDIDGYIDHFQVNDEDVNKVDCNIESDSTLSVKPAKDWNGMASCTIAAVDNEDGIDETSFNINVTPVNDATKITSYLPNYLDPKISEDGGMTFSIEKEDIDNDESELITTWFLDDTEVGNGDSYTFNADGSVKDYDIKVNVDDGELTSEDIEWILTVSDIPIVDTYDGDTTNFDGMSEDDLTNVYNLTLERIGFGKIVFPGPIDMRDIVDLDHFSGILKNIIGMDTNVFDTLSGKKASLWFYNLDFVEEPDVYYTNGFDLSGQGANIKCDNELCKNRIFNNNVLSFDVDHFTTFRVGEFVAESCGSLNGFICEQDEACYGDELRDGDEASRCCSIRCVKDFSNYDDIDTCKDGIIGDLEVNIKQPDNKDEFKPGSDIDIEVRVDNNGDDDKDVIVEASLYNKDEDKVIEEVKSDNIEINDGKDETFEFTLTVPYDEDLDKNDEYILYVKAYEDGNEENQCIEDSVDMDLDLEKHSVVIDKFDINPDVVSCGDYVNIDVSAINIGREDEKGVSIMVNNDKLKFNQVSDKFDLDKLGDKDDSSAFSFGFMVPEDATEGNYNVNAMVKFADGSYSESQELKVLECENKGTGKKGKLDLITNNINVLTGADINLPVIVRNLGNEKTRFTLEVNSEGGSFGSLQLDADVKGNSEETLYIDLLSKQDIVGNRNIEILLKDNDEILDTKTVNVQIGSRISTSLKEASFGGNYIGATLMTTIEDIRIFPNDTSYLVSLIAMTLLVLLAVFYVAKKVFKK